MTSSQPVHNPILSAYESYQQETPLITRTVMSIQVVMYLVNLFFDLTLAFANKPVFTIYKFELYRIVTSLFICASFFSLIFSYYSFVPAGKRLELSTSSVVFFCNFLTIGVLSNVVYLVVTFILDLLVVDQYWLIIPSYGIWNALFGLISLECVHAHKAREGSIRRFLIFSIPTLYYPLALWVIFSIMGGFVSLAHLISITIGYGIGYGYLDGLVVSKSRCKNLEDYLGGEIFASQEKGFVASSSVTDTWHEEDTSGGSSSSSFHNLFSQWTSQPDDGSRSSVEMGSYDTPGAPRPGRVITPSHKIDNSQKYEDKAMPTSGGQQLGGRSRRQNPRQSRLNAIEQRMGIVNPC